MIVVTYNSATHIAGCLRSLDVDAGRLTAEIIVVDNASTDHTADIVAASWPRVLLVRNGTNLGFARAANQGLAGSTANVLLFLNPDTVVLPGALSSILQYLRANPSVGAVGARVWDDISRRSVQLSCRSFPSFHTALFNRYSLATHLIPRNPWSQSYLLSAWDHRQPRRVDWVSGCCMAVRRQVIDQIGAFDEGYWMYVEDVDLCYRAQQAGWETHYVPQAEIVHFIGRSSSTNARRAVIERHRSMWRFYRKYHRLAWPLDVVVRLAVVLRCGRHLLATIGSPVLHDGDERKR